MIFFYCGPENMKYTKVPWLPLALSGSCKLLDLSCDLSSYLCLQLMALSRNLTLCQTNFGNRRLVSVRERGCGVCERQRG